MLATGTAELIRRRAGVSLAAVGRVVDVEPSTVLMWERGEFFPSGERAVSYAGLLRELRETTDRRETGAGMSERLTLAWSEAAIHYFAERAIDPDLAAELGVRENGHGLEFPYPHGMGEQFARTRSLNGGGPKVRQPSGTMLVPWQPVRNGKAREVLVTEGESDALAAISALRRSPLGEFRDLPVLAIPGTGCPVKRVVEHLASTECQQAWVALDADDAGRAYTEKLIPLLGEKGIRICRVDFAEGFDLADSLAAVAEDERGDWIANALLDARAAAEET